MTIKAKSVKLKVNRSDRKTGFDVVVIGGGSAGLSAAASARDYGATVALIEQEKLGGECPNYACVPTKSMLAAAIRYDDLRRNGSAFGIETHRMSFNLEAMMARKDAVVKAMTGNKRLDKILEQEKVTVFRGQARFIDDESIKVGDHVLSAKAFIIATGSVPSLPPIAGLEEVDYWMPRAVTSMKYLPESVAIVGSGPVGCEFATFFSLLNIPVALFDITDRIMPKEDMEVSALAMKGLHDRGVVIHSKTKVLAVKPVKHGVRLTYQTGSMPRKTMKVDRLIIAAGRKPNIEGLDLVKAGVKFDDRGRIVFDHTLRVKGTRCFLAGDVTNLMQFTHTAHAEGIRAGENAARLAKGGKSFSQVDLRVVPYVIFVYPELACVGQTAEALVANGVKFSVYKFPIGALGRAVIERKRSGIIKVFVEKGTDRILGATMLGERAGEVIHELALAMQVDIPFSIVQGMIHAYPTMSEAIPGLMPA